MLSHMSYTLGAHSTHAQNQNSMHPYYLIQSVPGIHLPCQHSVVKPHTSQGEPAHAPASTMHGTMQDNPLPVLVFSRQKSQHAATKLCRQCSKTPIPQHPPRKACDSMNSRAQKHTSYLLIQLWISKCSRLVTGTHRQSKSWYSPSKQPAHPSRGN
jgi:hypothetical protein